jgi:hypothetical protein
LAHVYKYVCPLKLFELRACLTSLRHRLREGRRSLGVVETTTLRSPSFRRQAESRKVGLDHLKMKLGISPSKFSQLYIVSGL